MTSPNTSRRTFLKGLGAGALSLVAVSSQLTPVQANTGLTDTTDAIEPYGVLIDLTRCTGCESCVLACKKANNRNQPTVAADRLSSDAYCALERKTITLHDGSLADIAIKRQCMHCLHPACASACTVGALRKQANGPVVYDSAKCIGCRYCQYACPFGVPTYEWNNALGLIHKCDMCATRIAIGESPACVGACPNGALRFGKRSALLAQAHAQIQTNPGRYVDHVYGEFEAGGTSNLYLSAVPFVQLGFPVLDGRPVTEHGESIMQSTPIIALGMAALATSLHLITRRHHELAAASAHASGRHDA
ncbi:MAG: 4Fe-4S dicluster domain-containing protein [Caldilineaceae bacterium]|nr:4Fe-4S dicluster domain-containing protein [Caldilineaceae bacterium]